MYRPWKYYAKCAKNIPISPDIDAVDTRGYQSTDDWKPTKLKIKKIKK
jgi:hypothetical protein